MRFKSMLMTLCAGCFLAACAQATDLSKTVINGKVKGMDNGILNVSYVDANGYAEDTVGVHDGKFVLTLPVDFPTELTLSLSRQNYARMWAEPGVLHLMLNVDDLSNYALQGSKTDELAKEYGQQVAAELKQIENMAAQMQNREITNEERQLLLTQYVPLNDTVSARGLRFVESHPDSYFSASLLWKAWWSTEPMPVSEAQYYLNLFSTEISTKSPYLRRMCADVEGEIHGKPGQKAPDFSTTDIHGNPFQLSSLFGEQYVILDFWASWCVPCRALSPHLKELYEKYHDKGLAVVCVADNDSMKDKWKKAIADDGLEEFIHVLRGHKGMRYFFNVETDISNKYGVHSIPTTFLIDKEGMVIGRYGDGESHEAMDAKLKEVFGF